MAPLETTGMAGPWGEDADGAHPASAIAPARTPVHTRKRPRAEPPSRRTPGRATTRDRTAARAVCLPTPWLISDAAPIVERTTGAATTPAAPASTTRTEMSA